MEPAREPTESDVLQRVDRGLELAVRDLGLSWEDEGRWTKREKYRFVAIDHHSAGRLPVSYSWFEYGISAVAGTSFVSDPMPISGPEEPELLRMDPGEIAAYFEDDVDHFPLERWWDEPILGFLEEFYDRYCPPHLREIYLANVRLRRILEDRVLNRLNARGAGVPEEDVEELRRELLRIQTALASDDEGAAFDAVSLRDLYDEFLEYSELLGDAVLAASRREEVEPYGPEYEVVTSLKRVFDDTVWPLITSVISYRTARGPNPDVIRETAAGKYRKTESSYRREVEDARRRCREADLLPGAGEYPRKDDSTSETVDELMGVLDGDRNGEFD